MLRRRLGDPDLQVVRWSRALGTYLDADGRPVEVPSAETDRRLILLERDGEPAAGVILDAALDDPGLASTITGLVRLTLDASELREELRAHGGDVVGLPSGEVTFLFADIEGSTAILERLGDRYGDLLVELRRIVSEVVSRHDGLVVDARADEAFAAFARAAEATRAAIEVQQRIDASSWPDGATLRVRIGLHTGHPELTPSGYVGIDVHRAARVMAAAPGGQVLASGSLLSAASEMPEVDFRPLGSVRPPWAERASRPRSRRGVRAVTRSVRAAGEQGRRRLGRRPAVPCRSACYPDRSTGSPRNVPLTATAPSPSRVYDRSPPRTRISRDMPPVSSS